MDDPKQRAIELLRKRGNEDAARALEQCQISLRHVGDLPPGRDLADAPMTDVMLHAPGELISEVTKGQRGGGGMGRADWGRQIEEAVRDHLSGRFGVRAFQWVETQPNREPRPGSFGAGPSHGRARP